VVRWSNGFIGGFQKMTLSEAFRKGTEILKNVNIDAPATDAGVLLCFVAKCRREQLYAHGDRELEDGLLHEYMKMLEKRAYGYPLQYLTGTQEFMSLPFTVGPGVLIPRQETELLVETVLKFCKDKIKKGGLKDDENCRILDMGAGSGCIAVSLAYYLPGCVVTAVDISQRALDIMRINARSNGVDDRVITVQSDLFENLDRNSPFGGPYDVIVSNPPYIRSADIISLQKEVREHEPVEALDGGIDGLCFYRRIIREAPDYLKEGGMLAFETGYDQAAEVSALMSARKQGLSRCFKDIRVYKDLAGIDRVVAGVLA